jgi:hypothetical protein
MAAGDATIVTPGVLLTKNVVRFTGTFGTKNQSVGIGMVGVAAGATANAVTPATWMDQTGTGATVVAHEGGGATALTGANLNQRVDVVFNWTGVTAVPASTGFGVSIAKDFANAGGGRVVITCDAGVDPAVGAAAGFEVYLIYKHSIVR